MASDSLAEQLRQIRQRTSEDLQQWGNQFIDKIVIIKRPDGTPVYRGQVISTAISLTNLYVIFSFKDRLIPFPSDEDWSIRIEYASKTRTS